MINSCTKIYSSLAPTHHPLLHDYFKESRHFLGVLFSLENKIQGIISLPGKILLAHLTQVQAHSPLGQP
jgi:hypothetical protein